MRTKLAIAASALLCCLAAPAASANHSITDLVAIGPTGGNGPNDNCAGGDCNVGISQDGKRVSFSAADRLVAADTDSSRDVYERTNGAVTLLSTGPSGGNGSFDAFFSGASSDGSRVFFSTAEALVPGDADDTFDVYERTGGVTSLVGPTDFKAASADGSKVILSTREQLTPDDPPEAACAPVGCLDVYVISGGTATLASVGADHDATFRGASTDGTRVFFDTIDHIDGDTDTKNDVYEYSAGTVKRFSTGPAGGNGAFDAKFVGASEDGSRVFFSTDEAMTPDDVDQNNTDIFERSGGTTTLISTGPSDTHAWNALPFIRLSGDGTHVVFLTYEVLVPEDTGYRDVYERVGGVTKLVSKGPSGGDGPFDAMGDAKISSNGQHIVFGTVEKLTPDDMDSVLDYYDRSNGTTTLLTPGLSDYVKPILRAVSDDGTRVIFDTDPEFDSGEPDVYERFAGAWTLLSTGPNDHGGSPGKFDLASPDATHVLFHTAASLVPADQDFCESVGLCTDIYESKVGYPIPQSASALHVSLVPSFSECGTGANPANGQHAAPFDTPACLPPKQSASQAAHLGPGSTGTADLATVPGDVQVQTNLTDVTDGGGADYAPSAGGPDVTLAYRFIQTDMANCPSPGCTGPYNNPGNLSDSDLSVPAECTPTAGPEGSTCAANTSANAVVPGLVANGRQTTFEVFRVRLSDSGLNATRGDSDDRVFATQGIYIP